MIENKCKICRRLGEKLFLKGERCFSQKCAMVRRPYPPGPQKKRKSGPPSEYKKTLIAKQVLKNWYNLSEKQFKKYVKEALKELGKKEDISEELVKKLEKRLDNVIFRLGFARSRRQARQLVSHGYFLVNGKAINIPSYNLRKNDIISIKENKKNKGVFRDLKNILRTQEIPSWIFLDKNNLTAKIIGEPTLQEARPPGDIARVFEFYSK